MVGLLDRWADGLCALLLDCAALPELAMAAPITAPIIPLIKSSFARLGVAISVDANSPKKVSLACFIRASLSSFYLLSKLSERASYSSLNLILSTVHYYSLEKVVS